MASYFEAGLVYKGANMDISYNNLTSLEGCPDIISGSFNCSRNKLKSLSDGPKLVDGDYNCRTNQLTSLRFTPEHITGAFRCDHNQLTNLHNGPQRVDGHYQCSFNDHLTDLVGCASHIGGILVITGNPITSLIGIHKIIKSCKGISLDGYTVTLGGIGLLLIENLTEILDDSEPFNIIKSYLGSGTKGMMECSKELIEKGYSNYAKL